MYRPDNWVILKVNLKHDPHYRVLGGWSGGYLDGDSWRMNSGITSVIDKGDVYHFIGSSGSIYECSKNSYGLRMNNAHVVDRYNNTHPNILEVVPETTDWINTEWISNEKDTTRD
jgi:hypothetical protein